MLAQAVGAAYDEGAQTRGARSLRDPLPVIVVYYLMQGFLVSGLTDGTVRS